ncbi:MAG TPA: tetratricopeptide repeat protein [Gallionellaceae bacterium]|nr:tetratricopeptide repeat protein [Gallionellaceae bacterium]
MARKLTISIMVLVLSGMVAGCGSNSTADKEQAVLKAAEAAYYRKDFATAARGFQLLADRGNARAQFFLGEMYLAGTGVKQDDAQALKLERAAAEKGSEGAQYTLGGMYERGQGVPKDIVQAHVWYGLSAQSGDEQALRKKAALENVMSASQLQQAQEQEKAWIKSHGS